MPEKTELRKIYAARRKTLTSEEAECAAEAIMAKLASVTAGAELLGGYCALPGEPDLAPFLRSALKAGKTVALPRYAAEKGAYEMAPVRDWALDLQTGRYGIPEPRPELPALAPEKSAAEMLWLIPGVAFDRTGTRLGRGGGFYDRLLAGTQGCRIGVFFHCQMADSVLPHEAHDCRLNIAITEKTIIHFDPDGTPPPGSEQQKRGTTDVE